MSRTFWVIKIDSIFLQKTLEIQISFEIKLIAMLNLLYNHRNSLIRSLLLAVGCQLSAVSQVDVLQI